MAFIDNRTKEVFLKNGFTEVFGSSYMFWNDSLEIFAYLIYTQDGYTFVILDKAYMQIGIQYKLDTITNVMRKYKIGELL